MERTFSVFGDSISTFVNCNPPGFAVYYEGERARAAGLADARDTWWHQAASLLGGRVIANASYSGSMVAGEGFPAATSAERLGALRGPKGQPPTDVLVFLGTNDYGWGSAANQLAGGSEAAPASSGPRPAPAEVSRSVGPSDLEDFSAAYRAMLDGVRAVCAEARVWCLTLPTGRLPGHRRSTFAHALRGLPVSAYNEAIAEAARARGCRVADVAGYGLDYDAVDGTHPTRRGMAQLAALAAAAIEGHPQPDAAAFLPEGEGFWSFEPCCRQTSCATCPHAHNTGSRWDCVCGQSPRAV